MPPRSERKEGGVAWSPNTQPITRYRAPSAKCPNKMSTSLALQGPEWGQSLAKSLLVFILNIFHLLRTKLQPIVVLLVFCLCVQIHMIISTAAWPRKAYECKNLLVM